MTTLSYLVSVAAWVTGLQKSNVFAYGRFAREAGFIAQGGRGTGGARMTIRDAANLLIAIGGAEFTRHAGTAIADYRAMTGILFDFRCEDQIREWLKPLRLSETTPDPSLKTNFGGVLEFLIEQAGTGELYRFLDSIPSLTTSTSFETKYENSDGQILLSERWEDILARGNKDDIRQKPTRLFVEFDRSTPMVTVGLDRWWGVPEQIARIDFLYSGAEEIRDKYNKLDLTVKARVSESTLVALALAVKGVEVPEQEDFPFDLRKAFLSEHDRQNV